MHFLNVHSHRMQNPICFYTILEQYNMFGESLSISTVICAIKEPRVMRHMNTEVALFTAAVEQRIAQHSGCDCHHSVVHCALFVAVGDGGVWRRGYGWCCGAVSHRFILRLHLKARNPDMRRAKQKPGSSHNLCLIACDSEGDLLVLPPFSCIALLDAQWFYTLD